MRPTDVVDRALRLLLAHDMTGFAGLWASDGTMEFPFAPPGAPQHLDGRAAVAEYLRHYTDQVDVRGVVATTVHETLDPEVVIWEFTTDAVAVASGAALRPRYIAVITVRDGEIAAYRDYWNPQLSAGVFTP